MTTLPSFIISADSHVAENEAVYQDIDPAYRDRRPRAIEDERIGAGMAIPGMPIPVPMGMICTAGRPPEKIGTPMPWSEVNPAGFDSSTRLEMQDRDGIHAEVLYPSVGMILCLHPDVDYRKACFDAYNRWLRAYCERDAARLIGIPQAAVRTVDEGIQELEELKAMGFRGVMLAGEPCFADYDSPEYDPLWEACVALEMPVCFHILTSKQDVDTTGKRPYRGPRICNFMKYVRGNQDVIALFIFGAVFERHPQLKIVSVESDASWAPHFCSRMDHAYNHHRFWDEIGGIQKHPSEYFRDNVYLTFQDDMPVGRMTQLLAVDKLLWANDFPHSDGIWPHSRQVLQQLTGAMTSAEAEKILCTNAAQLFRIPQ